MPRVQFIGQVSQSFGNTLPELCSRLKNFGISRMFVRTAQDQNREVSYIVLTRSRPMITRPPPKAIFGKLDEIAVLTQKPTDIQSEFYGHVVDRGVLKNGGREMKILGAINPDWRLILRSDEAYFRKNTIERQETTEKKREETNIHPLQEHIPDILKFWQRANG